MSISISRKFIPLISAAAGFLLLLRAAIPAAASPADCEAIGNAFNAVAGVPAYRSVTETPASGFKMEGIVIGEMVYANIEGKWTKVRLKPGGRKGMLDAIMSMSSIYDCKEIRTEALPVGRTKVYEYMITPPKGFPGVSDKPARHVVWIGVSDGLVHKMAGEDMQFEITYDKVVAPIP